MGIYDKLVIKREKAKSFGKNHLASALMWACYGITAASIIVRIVWYTQGRSLCWDEAALAENIITRSFASLLAAPLVNAQTAPALYLYAVQRQADPGIGSAKGRFFL